MSLLKLPVDILENLFDCEQLVLDDFKNLRLAHPALNDVTCRRLFQALTLDLDNPVCLGLIIGKQVSSDDTHSNVARRVQLNRGKKIIVIEDHNDEEKKLHRLQEEMVGGLVDGKENGATKEVFHSRQIVDFAPVGKHVLDLKIKGSKMGNKFPTLRDQFLSVGMSRFLSLIPNLRSISVDLNDRALITPSWSTFLSSICPPDSLPSEWDLHIAITRRMDNSSDDEIYRNLPNLHNITTLHVSTEMRFSRDDDSKRERIGAAVTGLAKVIGSSPHLRELTCSLGSYCDFPFDMLLSRIPGTNPLPIATLVIGNVGGPLLLENVKRLTNLEALDIREPWSSSACCSKDRIACMWMHLQDCNILLSKIKVDRVCKGFISYLGNPALVGVLTSVNLRCVSATSNKESDDFACEFWSAITLHAKHIENFIVNPSYYGKYCWTPGSAASVVLSKLTKLKTLSMCPADEGSSCVEDFLKSIWMHDSLEKVQLVTSIPNCERGARCGTNSAKHSGSMRNNYLKTLGNIVGINRPTFSVHSSSWFRNESVWEAEKDAQGLWRMTNNLTKSS